MSLKALYGAVFALLAFLLFHSCKKEYSCEGCQEQNKAPLAVAGPDTVITLPTDSFMLDGSKSSDPDGTISAWQWTKVSGPASFTIVSAALAKTVVKTLKAGVYQFELTVKDNGELSAKDTMMITVGSVLTNHPPIACAGADKTITLPTNSVALNGSCSTDPDNNIIAYQWTKIAGPSSFSITNANSVQTQVSTLIEGVYQFELKLTDADGLIDRDTLRVIVNAASTTVACGNINRPIVNAHLIRLGTLSEARSLICVATTGNKILFNGGLLANCEGSSKVDIYDIAANTWSVAERPLGPVSNGSGDLNMAVAVNGSKVFFAGGDNLFRCTDYISSTLLTYDATTNIWDILATSITGLNIAAASVGNKILFAGGEAELFPSRATKVDIYNLTANSWSSASLSEERKYGHAAISVNNKVYIVGGVGANGLLSTIDIYDNATNAWSTANMQKGRAVFGAIAVNNKLYLAGGLKQASDYISATCEVEIIDLNTGASVIEFLSRPAKWNVDLGQNIVLKNNKIIFLQFDGGADADKFDIYDINTNSWSIGVLPHAIPTDASVLSVNNTIYIAGGLVNGTSSDQVWKLEF